jgi:hypothetical protein
VPARSGPWAVFGLATRFAERAAQRLRGWGQYLESLWSVSITRPSDAALLWNIILGKLSRARCWSLGAGLVRRAFQAAPLAGVAAWLAFVLLVQLVAYRHTANGLRLAGASRLVLAAGFALAALAMLGEYLSVRLLRRSFPERLRSWNALWFAASAFALLLYTAGWLIRCGLGGSGLRRPLTAAVIALTAAFAAFLVRQHWRKRRGS